MKDHFCVKSDVTDLATAKVKTAQRALSPERDNKNKKMCARIIETGGRREEKRIRCRDGNRKYTHKTKNMRRFQIQTDSELMSLVLKSIHLKW